MMRRAMLAAGLFSFMATSPGTATAANLPLAGDVLFALPPDAVARRVLGELPQLQIGALNQDLAGAERARLAAGSHEWVVRAGVAQRRAVLEQQRFREQELGAERAIRWFGKAAQDRALGEQGVALAAAQRADAWHEAGRALMDDWYAALQAQASVQRLAEQHALVAQLQGVAARRVKAGDGRALEELQAGTELRRFEALLEQARQDAALAQAQLAATYPHLPPPQLDTLPEPRAVQDAEPAQVDAILVDNHELELAQVEAAWHGMKAQRARSERMPDPVLGVRAGRERGGQERTVGITLSMALPGAARSAESDAAALRARMAAERVAQTTARVQLAARKAVSEQRHSYMIWDSLRAVAQQSARAAALMEKAYQAGESSLSDALLSRRQALDAALAAQSAQIVALAAGARVGLDAHALWALD